MSTWLVTGGAGYIGSHVIRALQAAGMHPVVIDDLSHGLEHRVPEGVPLVRARIQDRAAVAAAIRENGVTGVIHLAALKAAGESVEIPLQYFTENVGGMIDLLEVMKAEGVRNLVYSSSAAVYGTPAENPVREDAPLVRRTRTGKPKWWASGSHATAVLPGTSPGLRCATSTWPVRAVTILAIAA